MKRKFIHAVNVTKIAKTLLQLDLSHWQEKYCLDAPEFLVQLQQALEQYLHPPDNQESLKHWNSIDNIEYTLKNLILNVNSLIGLLTQETQQKIEQKFTKKPEGIMP